MKNSLGLPETNQFRSYWQVKETNTTIMTRLEGMNGSKVLLVVENRFCHRFFGWLEEEEGGESLANLAGKLISGCHRHRI